MNLPTSLIIFPILGTVALIAELAIDHWSFSDSAINRSIYIKALKLAILLNALVSIIVILELMVVVTFFQNRYCFQIWIGIFVVLFGFFILKIFTKTRFTYAGLFVLATLILVSSINGVYLLAPNPTELKARGEVLVGNIEEYETQNGEYPERFEDTGNELPSNFLHGYWTYQACFDEQNQRYSDFSVCAGEYSLDGFQLCWSCESKEWIMNN